MIVPECVADILRDILRDIATTMGRGSESNTVIQPAIRQESEESWPQSQ